MDCRRVQELLPDYSVELLDERTSRLVDTHLDGCADCRMERKALDSVVVLVEQYGAKEPPPGLFNAVRNRIEAGEVKQDRPAWWAWFNLFPVRAVAMTGAVAALVAGLIAPVGQPAGPTPTIQMFDGPVAGGMSARGELANSIRQHAMAASEGPLADRVAWEAMAQLATQDAEKKVQQ